MSIPVLCTSQTRQSTCNIRHAVGLERVWVEGIPLMNCSLSLMCKCGGHLGRITGNSEVMHIPDGIPKDLLNNAECVIVIPSVLKFAFGVGGDFGRGAITCRTGQHFTGRWSAPALFALEGANIGFQLGGQATDFVLLVMNPKGAESILSSKVKLGADASAAAGPKGRTAAADTDIVMRAEVLTYSRSRGLFAGISL